MHRRHRFLSALALWTLAAARPAAAGGEPIEKFYKLKCSKCHKLHDPLAYDDESWAGWMQKMKKKARLSDAQYKDLKGYLDGVRSAGKSG